MRLGAISGRHRSGHGWYVRAEIIIEPRDMWIGLYWKRYPRAIEAYVCIIPCIPLHLYWQWRM